MSTNNNQKNNSKLSKRTFMAFAIVISLVVALFFAVVRLSTGDESGQRFSSIENRISDQSFDEALTRMNAEIGSHEGISGEVMGATVYIRIDMIAEADREAAQAAATHAFEILYSVLPRETYFTAPEGGMAYNIEIKAFDVLEEATYIIMGVQSFKMENVLWQNLMEPRNEEAANRAQAIQDERDAERERRAQEAEQPEPEPEPEAEPAPEATPE